MAVTVTPLDGNVNKAGTFTKVPADDPSNPAAGKLPTGAPLYYDAVTAGGDPSWPPLRQDMTPPLPNQPQRLTTKVLLEVDTPYSTCTWDLYNLKEKAVGDAVEAGHPMAMTSYKKATNLRDRPGRKLLVDDGNGQYMEQPLYQDYPVPVFKRANGPRVVVDLPVPNYDPSADTAFNFVIDLFLPGSHAPEAGVPQVAVTVKAADGSVDVGAPAAAGAAAGGTGTGTGTGGGAQPGGQTGGQTGTGGGATAPAPTPKAVTAIPTAGTPGGVVPADAAYSGLGEVRNDPTMGDAVMAAAGAAAWATGEYVDLVIKTGDTDVTGPTGKVHWDGATWDAGAAADAPDVAAEDVDVSADVPDMSWTKQEICDYLDAEGISYSPSDTKAELLDLV